jgi:ribonuclease HI
MGKKTKFYAVVRGRQTGIFDSWEECKMQVSGMCVPLISRSVPIP